MSAGIPSFFTDPGIRLLLFGGKGGVGKTSCATATALKLAKESPGKAFFLVSTDPAHSVRDSLAGAIPPPNLEVAELDAQASLITFQGLHSGKLREIAERGTFLDSEDISKFIDLSLPGLDELQRAQVPVTDIVVNRLYPDNGCPVCSEARALQTTILGKVFADPHFLHRSVWGVPLYPAEVKGAEGLSAFWEGVTPLTAARAPSEAPVHTPRARVQDAVGLPAAPPTLVLFAGKGGVGKTTLACATSLHLAEKYPGREVLLVSIDAAHCLSACLQMPVGGVPTPICSGLAALEIDAASEFKALRKLYAEELEGFLESLLTGVDLAFDREAMEKILDLAPPGLDEVIALTRAMELLEEGAYQTLVLDCAPTGHLIRFLEMPDLIDRWLKVFFGLFLKYRQIFRLPRVAQRLVQVSKHLKHWRNLLADSNRCALNAVTIPTDMAFEETKDLLAACGKAKIPVPMLFLNLVTPASPCPLCVALRERESVVLGQFRETFPLLPQVLVYRCGEPRGLESLGALGRELYKPSAAAGLMIRQAQEIERMANELGLKQDDLNLDLGPLGKLL